MVLKFSHRYTKLYGQTSAYLLAVIVRNRKELNDGFVFYDTFYKDNEVEGNYQLPDGRLIILVFFGNKFIPFTTVRPWNAEKEAYYCKNRGKRFDILYLNH